MLDKRTLQQQLSDFKGGTFFYPCCGSDTWRPLMWFLPLVDTFHFVDIMGPVLPALECDPPEADSLAERHRSAGRIPARIVVSRTVHRSPRPHRFVFVPFPTEIMPNFGYMAVPVQERVETWTLAPPLGTKKIIIAHTMDAFHVFLQIRERLAVFFYRGDSLGEGGSGQLWLGPDLFPLLLEKLQDDAIIATDGSNAWPPVACHAWEPLWSEERYPAGFKFVYENREFECLGDMGKDRGWQPTRVWRVRKRTSLDNGATGYGRRRSTHRLSGEVAGLLGGLGG